MANRITKKIIKKREGKIKGRFSARYKMGMKREELKKGHPTQLSKRME